MRQISTTRSRTSTKDLPYGATEEITYVTKSTGSIQIVNNVLQAESTMAQPVKFMDDNITPDFTARIKSGEVIMNDMSSLKHEYLSMPKIGIETFIDKGSYTISRQYAIEALTAFRYMHLPEIPLIATEDLDYYSDITLSRLYGQISRAPAQMLVTAGEFNKSCATLNRVIRIAIELFKKASNYRKLAKTGVITAAQAADAYLEVRYGLRPIMYEIKGIIEGIQQFGTKKSLKIQVHTEIPDITSENVMSYGSYTPFSGHIIDYKQVESVEGYMTAGAILRFKQSEFGLVDIFGLDEILEAAVELYPLSFIANWFFNLTDWLRTWTPKVDVNVAGTYLSLHQEGMRVLTVENFRKTELPSPSLTDTVDQGTRVRTTSTTRYANPTIPKLPRLRINLDRLKVLDLIAIFGNYSSELARYKL